MKKLILVTVMGFFLLGGCAEGFLKMVSYYWTSSEQPYGNWAAYWDNKYSEDIYQIWFSGRAGVKLTVLEDFSSFRAAQYTIGAGKEYFVVECADIRKTEGRFINTSYSLRTKVRVLRHKPPTKGARQASEVIETIGMKYGLPPHGKGWKGPEK